MQPLFVFGLIIHQDDIEERLILSGNGFLIASDLGVLNHWTFLLNANINLSAMISVVFSLMGWGELKLLDMLILLDCSLQSVEEITNFYFYF